MDMDMDMDMVMIMCAPPTHDTIMKFTQKRKLAEGPRRHARWRRHDEREERSERRQRCPDLAVRLSAFRRICTSECLGRFPFQAWATQLPHPRGHQNPTLEAELCSSRMTPTWDQDCFPPMLSGRMEARPTVRCQRTVPYSNARAQSSTSSRLSSSCRTPNRCRSSPLHPMLRVRFHCAAVASGAG